MEEKDIKKQEQQYSSPYEFYGKLPKGQAILLGMQHVMAMFIGNLTPLIILFGACGMVGADFAELRVQLLQNAMIMAGVVTLIQLYAIGPVGGKVPIVMGTSSGFIGIFKSISELMGGGILAYGAIMGASLIGGIFEGFLGFILKPLRRFFPPIVTGTVVITIGLSLISVGISYFGGGSTNPDYGSVENWFLGIFVIVCIVALKHFCKGMVSVASILIAIVAGYIVAVIMSLTLHTTGTTIVDGQVVEYTKSWVINWDSVAQAKWIEIPKIMPVKMVFSAKAIIPTVIMFIVTAVETIGDISGCIEGGLNREATDKELSGGVSCDGFGSALAAAFGVLPNTSFSQNVGLVTMTKVVNRYAFTMGAIFLILAGFCPKLAAIVNVMPQSVLGGAAVMMFSSIVVSGITLVNKAGITTRTTTIFSLALGLGYGLGTSSAVLDYLPETISTIFGGSGIVPAAIIAILLNIILPKEKTETK